MAKVDTKAIYADYVKSVKTVQDIAAEHKIEVQEVLDVVAQVESKRKAKSGKKSSK